jgi:hypothetical protein
LRDGGFLKVELWKDFLFEESKVWDALYSKIRYTSWNPLS